VHQKKNERNVLIAEQLEAERGNAAAFRLEELCCGLGGFPAGLGDFGATPARCLGRKYDLQLSGRRKSSTHR